MSSDVNSFALTHLYLERNGKYYWFCLIPVVEEGTKLEDTYLNEQ